MIRVSHVIADSSALASAFIPASFLRAKTLKPFFPCRQFSFPALPTYQTQKGFNNIRSERARPTGRIRIWIGGLVTAPVTDHTGHVSAPGRRAA